VPVSTAAKPVYVHVDPCLEPVNVVMPVAKTHATPTPAPPSPKPEPQGSPQPKVKVSSSFYQGTPLSNGKPTVTTCKVGFWNLTSKTVTIQVAGQSYVLAASKGMTLVLPREFVWQLDQDGPQSVTIPADRANYEIVLR
jgi:hypothetical protein